MAVRLKPLSEQVIVVTGASSGIGLTTSRMAAGAGARVVLTARSEEALEAASEVIRRRGGEAISVVADVSREADLRRVAEAAVRAFGGFDTWVNNAGVSVYGRIQDVPLEDQRQVFETDYWGVVHGCRVALEHLQQRGGAIINVGSVLSQRPFPLQGAYSAAKHAVKGFTDALRMELIHDRVPVSLTLIKPAAIDTPYQRHAPNYLPHEPRNPPPLYAPDLVAQAILHAAEHPVRELTVGGAGRLMEALDHWLPAVSDTVMAYLLPSLQQQRRPAADRGPAGLHRPAGHGHERSGHDYVVRERSAYTWLARHPYAVLGAAALSGALLALAGERRVR